MREILWALRYALATTRHKWFVLVAGLRVGRIPLWRLLVHDLSKYGPWEVAHYGRQFFGDRAAPERFAVAWLHHQNTNPHHWEFWIPRTAHFKGVDRANEPLEMPETYVREMFADWLAASRAYGGAWPTAWESWTWWQANRAKIRLHLNTLCAISAIGDGYFARRAASPRAGT